MSIELIILVGIGLAIAIGFLRQFGLLKGKGLLFTIAAVAALFGLSLFQSYRRKKLAAQFKEKEKELKKQEEALKELQERFDLSKDEVAQAQKELEKARLAHAQQMLEIEAEKKKDLLAAKEKVNNMTPKELLASLSQFADS